MQYPFICSCSAGGFVAGIYSTVGQPLAGEWALLWGVCLSLITALINVLIACCPIYSVLWIPSHHQC